MTVEHVQGDEPLIAMPALTLDALRQGRDPFDGFWRWEWPCWTSVLTRRAAPAIPQPGHGRAHRRDVHPDPGRPWMARERPGLGTNYRAAMVRWRALSRSRCRVGRRQVSQGPERIWPGTAAGTLATGGHDAKAGAACPHHPALRKPSRSRHAARLAPSRLPTSNGRPCYAWSERCEALPSGAVCAGSNAAGGAFSNT